MSNPIIQQMSEGSTMGGGQQGNYGDSNLQIQGDKNSISYQNIVYLKNDILEDRINKLQEDFLDFQQRFKDVIIVFEKFRSVILSKIDSLNTEDINTKLELLDLVEKSFKYQARIESINDSLSACQTASLWLAGKRKQLVLDVQRFLINKVEAGEFSEVVSPEQIMQFCKNIDLYLFWIGNKMAIGRTPEQLPQVNISRSLSVDVYIEAFEFIKNQRIYKSPDLPQKSVKKLKTYLKRFIIDALLSLKE